MKYALVFSVLVLITLCSPVQDFYGFCRNMEDIFLLNVALVVDQILPKLNGGRKKAFKLPEPVWGQ